MSDRKWEACPPNGQWGWTVFGPSGLAANVHTGEADALRFAASEKLLAACVNVLGSSTHRGQCIFCGARIDEAHAEYCPTIPLRSVIRAAREGK